MVFLHALQGILSLQIIVSIAYVLARKGWFSPETQILLPRLVTTVALPSYLFYTITHSFGRDDLVHLIYGSIFPLFSILLTFAVALLVANGGISACSAPASPRPIRSLSGCPSILPCSVMRPRPMCCCISLPIPPFSGASAATS